MDHGDIAGTGPRGPLRWVLAMAGLGIAGAAVAVLFSGGADPGAVQGGSTGSAGFPAAARDGFGAAPSPTLSPSRAALSPSPSTGAKGVAGPVPSGSRSRSPSPRAELGAGTVLTIRATTVLARGESVQTDRIRLTMRADGELALSDLNGTVRWQAGTAGRGDHAVFQDDGHFVVYDSGDRPQWASGTAGRNGAVLVLTSEGTLAIVFQNTVVWSSKPAA